MRVLGARSVGCFVGMAASGCALVVACGSTDDPGGGGSSGVPGEGGTSGSSGSSGSSGTSGTSGSSGDAATDSPMSGETPCDPAKTDCKTGEVCTDISRPAAECRAGCTREADCALPKTSCVLLTVSTGACVPTCTPFGTDCPPGLTCTAHAPEAAGVTQTSKSAFCRKAGATALGASCVDDPVACGANAECLFFQDKGEGPPQSRCHALCDGTHACGAGKGTCITRAGEAFGFCDGG